MVRSPGMDRTFLGHPAPGGPASLEATPLGWRGAKPEMSSKCSKLWVSLLPNSGSADTWHRDDGNDGSDDEEESYDKDSIYWAITVSKAHAKHFAYAFFKSLQTTLWRLLCYFHL